MVGSRRLSVFNITRLKHEDGTTMAYRWPAGTVFNRLTLDVEDRSCPVCSRSMHVCDHRYHHLWTFQGATQVINRLVRCPDPSCVSRGGTFSPEAELSISMPRWCMGWDVLCWLGHRRFARHWSVPQLRAELQDTYHIWLSDDALAAYLGRYQTMLAARQQDPERLADDYRDIASLVLTIDGLQPEKGHETLYVVRELRRKRVWFAEPLLSSATEEVQRVIALARQWAERLAKPVGVWMSDKQDAFVQAIGTEFPPPPPLLPKPLSAGCGQARAGAGQSGEGQDASQSARVAHDRTPCAGGAAAPRAPCAFPCPRAAPGRRDAACCHL